MIYQPRKETEYRQTASLKSEILVSPGTSRVPRIRDSTRLVDIDRNLFLPPQGKTRNQVWLIATVGSNPTLSAIESIGLVSFHEAFFVRVFGWFVEEEKATLDERVAF